MPSASFAKLDWLCKNPTQSLKKLILKNKNLKYEQTSIKQAKNQRMPVISVKIDDEQVWYGINECDKEIQSYEKRKLASILGMNTTAKVDMIDWDISMYDLILATTKLEKQFWVSLGKKNWMLLKLIRAKVREQCDKVMEHMEIGMEKEWMNEDEYIKSANMLKNLLEEQDGIISGLAEYVKL